MIKKFLLLSDASWKNMKKSIVASSLANFSIMLLSFVSAMAFWQVLQPFFGGTVDWTALWVLFGIGIVAVVVVYLLHLLEYNYTYISGNKASSEKRIGIAEHLRHLPLSFFERKNLTDLSTNIMADCSQIEMGFTSLIPSLIGNLCAIALACIILFVFDWRMALAVFITVPVSFGLVGLTTRWQRKVSSQHYETTLKVDSAMQEYLEGMKVTKAFGLLGSSYRDLENACLEMKRVNMTSEIASGSLNSLSTIILRIGTPITIYVGIMLFTAGSLDLVYFLFYLLLASRIYTSLSTPLSKWADIIYAGVALGRLRDIYDEPMMSGSSDIAIPSNEIEFDHVGFSYKQDSEVIKDVSIVIPEGKVTALVGPSGSGKSTLAKLAARFWDVDSGQVSIGGVAQSTLDPEYLLSRVSFVFQDVVLFNDTVYNNIKIGRQDATEEEVMAAAQAANCESFIRRLPDGYNSMIGENGSTLSGGERQRISIARAMLKDAPVVILDEATASLDPENEREIQRPMSKLVQGKTTLVVAHRLRTITDSDQIVVLDQGRVVEQGTHDQLMANQGLYHRLYTIQQRNLGWAV